LEEGGADYIDVARGRAGASAMFKFMERHKRPPYAPPFLKAGDLIIAQTAMILHYLGPRLKLVPRREADRLWAHQLQLTITDLVKEIHDTHHPISSQLHYEDQRKEAKRYTEAFWRHRVPKLLRYFEQVLDESGGLFVFGRRLSYVDLSLFQIVAGLRYAFPKRMQRFKKKVPRLVALHDRVAARPRIAAYLASERRIPFNEWGIFRHYKELDG
jgi:glutathione S-transferase